MTPEKEYRALLNEEFQTRVKKNAGYSIRAFARDLDLSPATVSGILQGKKKLTRKIAIQMCKKLSVSEKFKEKFVSLVVAAHSKVDAEKQSAEIKLKTFQFTDLDTKYLKLISNWYGLALMELTLLQDFQSSPEWIAKKLGTTVATTKSLISNLLELGMLKKDGQGHLFINGSYIANQSLKPSEEVKQYQRSILKKVEQVIANEPSDKRYMSQFLIATNEDGLKKIREEYIQFRNKIDKILSESNSKDRILSLSFQCIRLDHE